MTFTNSRNFILSNILLGGLLLGCGSDSGSAPAPEEEVSNTVPIVAIVGENTVQEGQVITLTANASDTDGSIDSVSWSTTSPDVVLSGTDTNTVSFTAPDIDSDVDVSIDVTVTDNEGATATQSITVTIEQIVASVTITGLVTDNIISNADVEVTVGGQVFSTTADENGAYTITITVDESLIDQLLQIRALGDSSINPGVEFVSQLGSLANLIEQAGSDGGLAQDENFGVNVTNVTTAEYALITRDGTTPTSDDELSTAISTLDNNEKNTLAALIKIVVDNPDYALPEGLSSTLALVSDAATADSFEQEVTALAPTLISETINTIVNDDSLNGESDIVGTWQIGSDVITFTRSGHYVHITTESEEGGDAKVGYEIGTYSWEQSTGILSYTTAEDSNGDSGLHNEFDEPLDTLTVLNTTMIVTEDTLTVTQGEEIFVGQRLASDSNPLVGGGYPPNTNFSNDLSMYITLDDRKSIVLTTVNSELPAGISYLYIMREYSYDADTSLFIVHSQKVYIDGVVVQERTEEVTRSLINVQGDIITSINENGILVIRNSYTTTDQDYLTDSDVIGNFSGTNGDIEFNLTFNADGTGEGSSEGGGSSLEWQVVYGQLLISLDGGDSTQIWSPTTLSGDTWMFNVNEYDDVGEIIGSSTGTLIKQL